MDLMFANPAAAWALLGLPAVLAIHFLQSRARPLEISTSFLLEPALEEERRGAVWTRLRNGRQLWLQLAAVLLLTLLLAKPMWLRPESTQAVAVVLDESYSMQVFRDPAARDTAQALRRLRDAAGHTVWYLLSSDPGRAIYYRGESLDEALAALRDWHPSRPAHDPRPMWLQARDAVGADGLVLWVTDHVDDVAPAGVHTLAAGRPTANSGFTGLRFERDEHGGLAWNASLMHYGFEPATRTLRVAFDDGPLSAPQTVTLQPDVPLQLRGRIPEHARRGRLELDADDYRWDDVLPFVVPVRKPVTYRLPDDPLLAAWAGRVMRTVPDAAAGDDALVTWGTFTDPDQIPRSPGIYLYTGETVADFAPVIAERHPLTRDLSWAGFLGRPLPDLPRAAGDTVLLWMGTHPLLLLREPPGTRQLIVGFDVLRSNADRLPSFILCLHRFVEQLRAAADGYEAVNLETHQRLPLGDRATMRFEPALAGTAQETTVAPPVRTPAEPGYLQFTRDGRVWMDAATMVADTAEADLRQAAARPLDPGLAAQRRIQSSRRDALTPLWFALLIATLLASWYRGAGRTAS